MSQFVSSIIVACITGVVSLIGTIITVLVTSSKNQMSFRSDLEKHEAIQDVKIEELTREVREHNGFARRMPVIEEKITGMDNRIKRLEDDGK